MYVVKIIKKKTQSGNHNLWLKEELLKTEGPAELPWRLKRRELMGEEVLISDRNETSVRLNLSSEPPPRGSIHARVIAATMATRPQIDSNNVYSIGAFAAL